MAIAFRANSLAGFGQNSFAVSIPGGTTTGDMMLLLAGGKAFNASVSVSGWTQLNRYENGTDVPASDGGSMFVTAWWKEHDGSEANPTLTEGATTWNVVGAGIISFSKDTVDTWVTPVMRGGGDASAGTGFSVTTESDPGVQTGDVCVSFAAFNSDGATPCSSHLVATQTGVTFSNTHSPSTDPETTTGSDMGMCANYGSASGTGSAAPVIAATLAGSFAGSAGLIRLRVLSPALPKKIRVEQFVPVYFPNRW